MNRRSFVSSMMAGGFLLMIPAGFASARDIKYYHDFSVPDDALKPLERDASWWHEHLDDDAWESSFRRKRNPHTPAPG